MWFGTTPSFVVIVDAPPSPTPYTREADPSDFLAYTHSSSKAQNEYPTSQKRTMNLDR